MKFSTTLALCASPLALAKAVQNVYPAKRDSMLAARKPQSAALVAELQALGLSGLGLSTNAATEVIILWVNPGAGAATTNVNNPVGAGAAAATGAPLATGAAAAPPAAAATHQVTVGGNAGLAYTPSEVKAAVGDMVVFTFMSTNHTVTQSAFDTPCVAMAGGMDSGFQPNVNNTVNPPPQVAMQVMVDTPLCTYRTKGDARLVSKRKANIFFQKGSTASRRATAEKAWPSPSTPPRPRPRPCSSRWPLPRTARVRVLPSQEVLLVTVLPLLAALPVLPVLPVLVSPLERVVPRPAWEHYKQDSVSVLLPAQLVVCLRPTLRVSVHSAVCLVCFMKKTSSPALDFC